LEGERKRRRSKSITHKILGSANCDRQVAGTRAVVGVNAPRLEMSEAKRMKLDLVSYMATLGGATKYFKLLSRALYSDLKRK